MTPVIIRPRRTTPNYSLPVPGDIEPADFVKDLGVLADAIDGGQIMGGGPTGPAGERGRWWVGTQAEYDALATKSPAVLYLIRT